MDNPQTIRLDNLLSGHGVSSRRKVEQFLQQNEVKVNDKHITQPGFRFTLHKDQITINNKTLELGEINQDYSYFAVNKPKGMVSTIDPNQKRKSIVHLVPNSAKVFPVGMLDEHSSGLVLLTNDGNLAFKLTEPNTKITKTYLVWVAGKPSEKRLAIIREGAKLKNIKLKPAQVTLLKSYAKRSLVEVVLQEGKSMQIRQIFTRVGINIIELKSISFGPIQLEHLGVGQFRKLEQKEIDALNNAVVANQYNNIPRETKKD